MGANDRELRVGLNIETQITNYENSLKQLQNGLANLRLPNNLRDQFNGIFVDAESEIKNLRRLTENNELNVVNEKQVEASFGRIKNLYNALVAKMKSTGMQSAMLEKDAKAIDALDAALKKYNKDIANATKESNRAQKAVDDLTNKYNDATNALKKEQKALDDMKKSLRINGEDNKEKTTEDRTKELQEQLELQKKIYEEAHGGSAKGFNLTNEYKTLTGLLKTVEEDTKSYNEQVKKTAEVQDAADAATKKYDGNIANLKATAERAKATLEELSNNSISKLKEELGKTGINWDSFGEGFLDSIKNADDLTNKLEELALKGNQDALKALEKLKQQSEQSGDSFNELASKVFESIDAFTGLKGAARDMERMTNTMLRFFSIDNAVRLFKRAIRSAYNTIKDLDKVMTETAVVTEFSVGDMWSQLPEYTKRANELGVSIHSAYEAATIYYQQGLKTNEVMAVSNATLKMARIAGLEASEATDRMTNALRGFNMEITETNADRIADVYSKLAAITASNVDEISTAMTKTASLANSANMSFESTAAFLAQIIETTRESAETAGTALKTVIARFSEVKKLYGEGELLGTDEEGQEIDVNKVSTALRTAGINLNEFLTGAKGLDEVFMELASKWDTLSIVQQRYIATMAAGSRQQSRFIALMSNYARTQQLVEAATNADGAAQKQYEKTLESLETKLARLKNAWDEFTMGLANSEMVKGAIDLLTGIINAVNKLTAAAGETSGSILKLVAAFTGFVALRSVIPGLLKTLIAEYGILGGVESKVYKETLKNAAAFKGLKSEALITTGVLAGLAVAAGLVAKHLRDTGQEEAAEKWEKLAKALTVVSGAVLILIPIIKKLDATLKTSTIGIVLGVIGAIVSLAIAFGDFRSELEKAQDQLEKSSEAAKKSKEDYDSVNNILEQIGEKEDLINQLVIGTEDWTNAVKDLNQAYLDLLATYPELAQFVGVNEQGQFYITNKEGFNQALKGRSDQAVEDSIVEQRDKIAVSEAEARDKRNKFTPYAYNAGTSTQLGGHTDEEITNLVAKALYSNEIKYSGSEDFSSAINQYLASKGYENVTLNWKFDELENLKDLGKSVSQADYATQAFGKSMSVLTQQLGSFNLPESLKKYYTEYFSTSGYDSTKSGIEQQAAAIQFATAVGQSAALKAFYNSNMTGKDIDSLTYTSEYSNLGISQEDFDNRINALRTTYQQLQNIYGNQADSFGLGAASQLLQLNAKRTALMTSGNEQDFNKGMYLGLAQNIASQLSKEDQAGFLQALLGIDLDSVASLADFPQYLSDLGINVEGTEHAIQDMIDKLTKLAEANKQVNFDSVNSLLEELNGRKSNERNWSKDQYDEWRKLGVTEGWVQTGEDQYTYTGSQEAMRTALQVESDSKGQGLDYNKYAGESKWATLQAAGTDEAAVARITGEAAALEDAQDELEAFNKTAEGTEERLEALKKLQFATEVAKWTSKLKELDNALQDDVEKLNSFEEGTSEYDNQLALMSTHINDAFGTNLDANFLKVGNNLDLLTKSLDGDQEAWEDLLINIDKASVESSEFANQFFSDADQIAAVSNALDSVEFEVDGKADMTQVVQELMTAGLTAEEIAEYLEKLSYTNIEFDAEVDENGFLKAFKSATAYKAPILGSNASNTFGGGGGSSGGGGGSNKSWKNPFDELYNLTEKINEALRDREKLEREYDRILKDRFATAEELRNNSLEEIANLRKEIYLQQQLLAGRRSQLQQLGNELYETEGGYKSFAEMGVTKYGSYDENTGVITIDWAAIDKITDTEEGGAVEAYIKRLEELQGQIEDVQDTIEGMEDTIEEIKDRNKEGYLDFEQKVYNALVARDQKVIDEFSSLSDTIETVNNRVLDELQRSVDLERQIRDNTKTEEDIADKEARLAYLQRDTSGANALEIMQLQKDIEEARQSYEDTLIDQTISQLQDDNSRAAEQREREIELMQAQLNYNAESGAYWEKTYDLISKAYNPDGTLNNNSELVQLLGENDSFEGLSYFGKQNWVANMAQEWMAAQEGLSNWFVEDAENRGSVQLANGLSLTYDSKSKTWKDKEGNIYTDLAWDPQSRQYTAVQSLGVGTTTTTGSTSGTGGSSGSGSGSSGEVRNRDEDEHTITEFHASADYNDITHSDYDLGTSGVTVEYQQYDSQYHYKNITDKNGRKSGSKELHTFSNKVCTKCGYKMSLLPEEILQAESTLINQGNDYHGPTFGRPSTQTSIGSGGLSSDINMIKKHFATGGLADFTGLAWLDGSKSSPELVLNPRDTENFITLKNILAQSLERGMGAFGGDNYFDIDILVDELGSDYDVDKLAERLKKQIYEDSTYRNVNTLNFIR